MGVAVCVRTEHVYTIAELENVGFTCLPIRKDIARPGAPWIVVGASEAALVAKGVLIEASMQSGPAS